MKILSLNTKQIFEIDIKSTGENAMPCPECSQDRRKKHAKSFSFNAKKLAGYCNHCEGRFVEHKPFEKINYIKPVFDNSFVDLRPEWLKVFLSKRSISESTLKKMKISEKLIWMPQTQKEEQVVCYPYFKGEEVVNIKYRGNNKSFKLESGAELCWYNYNALNLYKEIIIVEGEIDCLSFIEEGFDNCISVPNGANIGKMEYFDNSIQDLDKIEKFYLCTDNDEKGILLKNEFIRRLGIDKCYVCNLFEYKDANDFLVGKGRGELSSVILNAKIPKVEGAFTADDFSSDLDSLFKNGLQKGKTTGYSFIDDIVSWETKRLAIVTGTPSSGKSEFVDFLTVLLNLRYGWKAAYFTPENFPVTNHIAKLSEKIVGKKFGHENMSYAEYYMSVEYINDNFFWVNPPENAKLDTILEKFKYFIKSKGVKIVVVDPFNTIENEVQYNEQGKLLQKMVKFARANDVLFFLIAHPKKLDKSKSDGTYPMPTMYDIAGSSDFWNMADYGIALRREVDVETKANLNQGLLSIQKVKFKHLGGQGVGKWRYNFINGRYENEGTNWDNKQWIESDENQTELPLNEISNNILAFESESNIPKQINLNEINF
jgi:twinkle protein